MIKENKRKLLLSSIVILLPILFGVFFWNELPEQMVTHWGLDGEADGWSGRPFAVFGLPLLVLVIHWVCIFFTAKDPGNKGQNRKVFGLVIWITPVISLFACGLTYGVAFGKEFRPYMIINLLIGAVFIIIGNYLPKCKQNYTIGIKIKWTLENEENWNVTHRFAGKVWVAGGLLLLVCALLPDVVAARAMVVLLVLLVAVPVVYSCRYHKKQMREGTAVITPLPRSRAGKIVTLTAVAGILLFVGVLMFTGDIDVKYGEGAFTIEASYWSDLTVEYDAIERMEYRDQDSKGLRTFGLGSARLLAGAFRNEEFGNYTRYSYTKCDACVVLTVEGRVLVISGPDVKSTRTIYEKIKSNLA